MRPEEFRALESSTNLALAAYHAERHLQDSFPVRETVVDVSTTPCPDEGERELADDYVVYRERRSVLLTALRRLLGTRHTPRTVEHPC